MQSYHYQFSPRECYDQGSMSRMGDRCRTSWIRDPHKGTISRRPRKTNAPSSRECSATTVEPALTAELPAMSFLSLNWLHSVISISISDPTIGQADPQTDDAGPPGGAQLRVQGWPTRLQGHLRHLRENWNSLVSLSNSRWVTELNFYATKEWNTMHWEWLFHPCFIAFYILGTNFMKLSTEDVLTRQPFNYNFWCAELN